MGFAMADSGYVNMHNFDRLTEPQMRTLCRALQHVDPDQVFNDPADRQTFYRASRKLVRSWNQNRLRIAQKESMK